MYDRLALILVGDHLGQVKKVTIPKGEVSLIPGSASPSSLKPIVSIQPIGEGSKQLIANKVGELLIYDCIQDITKTCSSVKEDLIKALPITEKQTLFIYDKKVIYGDQGDVIKQKKGQIRNAQVNNGKIAIIGSDIPLKIFDIEKKTKIFEADPPDKDWLGIQPEIHVSGLDFVGRTRVVTCSKSDSVVRVYDSLSKPKPIISVDINQIASNEHAEPGRFLSVSSTGDNGHTVVVGSNVGQIMAVDLRFQVKHIPKKKLQAKNHKILGSFKGARGGSIKDLKIIPLEGEDFGYKVLSCCLDRYLRIHNFTRNSRDLDKHVYMTTKPYCLSPVFA